MSLGLPARSGVTGSEKPEPAAGRIQQDSVHLDCFPQTLMA